MSEQPPGLPSGSAMRRDEDLGEAIGRKAERKLRARDEGDRGILFGLGMFGLVGWSVAIPTVAGIALGLWLDAALGDRVSWTLTLLFVGVVLGCVNAWFWVRRESRHE
jgi:ATP synthase protein I